MADDYAVDKRVQYCQVFKGVVFDYRQLRIQLAQASGENAAAVFSDALAIDKNRCTVEAAAG